MERNKHSRYGDLEPARSESSERAKDIADGLKLAISELAADKDQRGALKELLVFIWEEVVITSAKNKLGGLLMTGIGTALFALAIAMISGSFKGK